MELWYNKPKEQVLMDLNTDPKNGLSKQEVAKRLESYGKNELEAKKEDSLFKKVLEQLKDPMIIVLLIAAFLSYSGFENLQVKGIMLQKLFERNLPEGLWDL